MTQPLSGGVVSNVPQGPGKGPLGPPPPAPPRRPSRSVPPPPPVQPIVSQPNATKQPDTAGSRPPDKPSLLSEINDLLSGQSGQVQVRTMKDDLAAVKPTLEKSPSPPQPPTPPPKTFPLPPRAAADGKKVVMPPPIKPKPKRHWLRRLLVGIIVVLVLAGGGVAVWYFYFPGAGLSTSPEPIVAAPAKDVLPAEATLLVQYRLGSDQDRSDILTVWQHASPSTPGTLTALMAGDPRSLLGDADVTELYYVVLAGEQRPYLVVPQTSATKELLTDTVDAQVLAQDGWYVVHPLSLEPYQQALAKSSLAAGGGAAVLDTAMPRAPLRIVIREPLISKIRTQISGDDFAVGQLQELAVAGQFLPPGTAVSISGQAILRDPPAAGGATASQQLLTMVPGDVDTVRLGADFSEDLGRWQSVSTVIDTTVLQQPAVSQLISSLSGPYAFYQRRGEDGSSDIGLIIQLPSELESLALGDVTIESALPALVPLILGRKSIAAPAFADNIHAGVPHRYVNYIDQTKTIDYAVYDRHVLISTSKEGMFTLLETVTDSLPAVDSSVSWQPLLARWGSVPAGRDLVLGRLTDATVRQFLPPSSEPSLPFGLSIAAAGSNITAQGIILLSSSSVATPTTTPTTTPTPAAEALTPP